MCDSSIRRLTLAEEARAAAQRFVQTGEVEANPHLGTGNALAYASAFERWVAALTASEGIEGSA